MYMVQNPNRTILGAPQKQYLKDQLLAANGKQTWKVLGQQVLFAHRCDKPSADQWDGTPASFIPFLHRASVPLSLQF